MQKNGEKQILIDKAKKSADNLFNQFIDWATHPDNPDRISLESAQLHESRFLALFPGLVKNHDVENINTTFDLMEKIIKKRIDENAEREWELEALTKARSAYRLYAKFINSIINLQNGESKKNKFANIFIPPTRNIEGHGENMDETDSFYSFDAETEDYLKGIIDEFSMAPLYTDEFTSKDLIYFLETSVGKVEYAESQAYNANDALEDALNTIEKDFIGDVYFLIYIGSNFEAKESLIDSAKRIIRKALREEISEDDMPDFKVAIAQDIMLMGGADLRLYAFDSL